VSDHARGIRIDRNRPAFLPSWSCYNTRKLSFHRFAFPQHVVALPEFLKLERMFPIWIHFRSFNSFTNVISFKLNQNANPTPSVRSFYLRKRRRWAIFVGPRDCERNTYFRNCRGCQQLLAPRASPRKRRSSSVSAHRGRRHSNSNPIRSSRSLRTRNHQHSPMTGFMCLRSLNPFFSPETLAMSLRALATRVC
jgi:hypothetical protein